MSKTPTNTHSTMFVRWKTSIRKTRWRSDILLSAVLVESRREGGRPRQKFIRHLGSVRQSSLGLVLATGSFWKRVDQSLGALDLSPEERRAIEARIALRVPRPEPEALEQARQEKEEQWAKLMATMKR